ncbi:MAG: NADH-quinone oxidoreductase subunit C [Hyphomicrobium sp.]|uniref:hydrogenase large subunit n=1 Tax=Hyphomicrobium sp. TaxID=82 RepID=UPI003D102CF2
MPAFDAVLGASSIAAPPRPWPRRSVDRAQWNAAAVELAAGRWTLVALWGEPDMVHMTVLDHATGKLAILSLACPDGQFPSVGRVHPPAIRLERAIADLVGLLAKGSPDTRPWLDHGRWSERHPLAAKPAAPQKGSPYAFLPVEGADLHQIPVGPVHAGIIEPGHFRFTASGETVVRLEERLGYVHRGVERLMAGSEIEAAARLAGRVSGDSTVAYALAFVCAVEAATSVTVPPRAVALRAVMAELERIANHLGDIGAICNDAAFALMLAHLAVLRERVLRAAMTAFGHRLMMDAIVPGGVARDLSREGAKEILAVLGLIEAGAPRLLELYDNTTSLQDRTATTGILSNPLAVQFGAGGFVGRASGRDFDCRRHPGYPPYGELAFDVPVRKDGDVNARLWIRVLEVEQSMRLIRQLLEALPEGPIDLSATSAITIGPQEGAALVEGFRGDIFVWVRLDGGTVARCHLRDPSWFQWPLLEAVIESNIVADFPLCNKSFNCSYAGHDL